MIENVTENTRESHNFGNGRIIEIDFLRTLAIVLMIIFHIVYDLNAFVGIDINYQSGFWYWEGKIAALIFITISGISSGFSRAPIKRGLKVLGYGMIITLVTYMLFREQYVRFGILHLLGTGMILFPIFKKINMWILLLLSIAVFLTRSILAELLATTSLFIPFGIMYEGFSSIDYYPIFPYISFFILGVLAYKIFYYKGKSLLNINYENRVITIISKNSLIIYLIHQPIILLNIYIFKLLN